METLSVSLQPNAFSQQLAASTGTIRKSGLQTLQALPSTSKAPAAQPALQSEDIQDLMGSLLQTLSLLFTATKPNTLNRPTPLKTQMDQTQSGLVCNPDAMALDRPSSKAFQTNAVADSPLSESLAQIQNDPEGAKLLQAAQKNGYAIEIGDTGSDANGLTVEGNGTKKIIINPNAPNFLKTLVHELVHAATPQDDDSQREEGIADVIGYRVASRIAGQPLQNEQVIFSQKVKNYPNLQASNAIVNSLAQLGITAFTLSA